MRKSLQIKGKLYPCNACGSQHWTAAIRSLCHRNTSPARKWDNARKAKRGGFVRR